MSKQGFKKLVCALLVACGLLLVGSNAAAYVYIHGSQCPNGAAWGSGDQPLDYWINQNGSDDVGLSQVESIMQDSFDTWGAPCCSSFSTNYRGTTSKTALRNDRDVVLSFEEQSWPTQMGNVNQTIAVTLSSAYRSCELAEGPILFNGVGFSFCTTGNRCTDLQAIATHEIGHNLGLGHSSEQSATMYAAYMGGTGARSLHQDDINGVCSLYRTSCSCSRDEDCGPNQVCNGNQCEEAPCQSNNDCPTGQECSSGGDCVVPSCSSSAECWDGYQCSNGRCVSSCPVCRDCETRADCGSNGFCANLGSGNKCITNCGQGGACPGDSTCFQVPAPSTSGSCSSSSECPSGDRCYQTQSGGVCATPCSSDAGCGDDQTCRNYGGTQICADVHYLCLNPDAANSGICPSTYVCEPDSDDGTNNGTNNGTTNNGTTNNGTTNNGTTNNGTTNNGTTNNGTTNNGTGPCDGVSCPSGESCQNGQCVEDDDDRPLLIADDDSSSHQSSCAVASPTGAAPASLMLLAVFGLGAMWRRRRSS